jgi:hypothetical protein
MGAGVLGEYNFIYADYSPLQQDPSAPATIMCNVSYTEPSTGTDFGFKAFYITVAIGDTPADTTANIRAEILRKINEDNETSYVDADLQLRANLD